MIQRHRIGGDGGTDWLGWLGDLDPIAVGLIAVCVLGLILTFYFHLRRPRAGGRTSRRRR